MVGRLDPLDPDAPARFEAWLNEAPMTDRQARRITQRSRRVAVARMGGEVLGAAS